MFREINLDDVVLSPATVAAWQEIAKRVARALAEIARVRGTTFAIPDERGRVNDDGSLTIFISVPGVITEAFMDVPAGEWAWASRSKG